MTKLVILDIIRTAPRPWAPPPASGPAACPNWPMTIYIYIYIYNTYTYTYIHIDIHRHIHIHIDVHIDI